MRRGNVFDARLDPVEGSEQAGIRPVVVVSRDAINDASPVVVVVSCTTLKGERRRRAARIGMKIGRSFAAAETPHGRLYIGGAALAKGLRLSRYAPARRFSPRPC